MPKPEADSRDERILILAPVGRDGELIATTLRGAGISVTICSQIDDFCRQIEEGAGVGAITEEALTADGLSRLRNFLDRQLPWSDFPFVVFSSRAQSAHSSHERYLRLKELRNFTIFERPIYPLTLLIAIDSALRARRRQYEARRYFLERSRNEDRIAQLNLELEQRVADRTQELAKTQAAFYEAQKMEAIGRLAGGVAHDFNNLVTGIIGLTQEVRDTLEPGTAQYTDLGEVLRAADRASALTRQLLAFGRKQITQQRVVNLNRLLQDMRRILEQLLGEDIEVEMKLNPELGNVRTDPGHMEQVIMNLVLNSRDAMRDGGKITITTENKLTEGVPSVCFSVQDNGAGMGEEILQHVFEPFYTTKERGKGTGLGLATVFGIVKQNGGDIRVTSRVGQGSTFTVFLPQAVGAQEDTPAELQTMAVLGGDETILLVEDEAIVRQSAERALIKAGYRVLTARDGNEALRLAERYADTLDLLLTDVVMPGLNGRDLAKTILAQRPDVPVLFMSGYTQDIILERGILESGIDFLQKTFSPEALCRKVRDVLNSRKAATSRQVTS